MRVLVTGATGYIGRYVVKYLLSLENYEIITTATRNKENAEYIFPELRRTTYIPKNINDIEDNYFNFFLKPDCMIHLSWEGLPNYNELFHIERNLITNYYFIKNMIQNGLTDITVNGTCFEYGLQSGCLNEEMIPNPVTSYGLAKDTLRRFIEILCKSHKFNMKWIRLFYVYGEGQSKNALWEQLKEAVESKQKEFNMSMGEQLRDYISVRSAAEYISRIAIQNDVTGIINCCSGIPVSIRHFVEKYFKERGIDMKLNLGHYSYPEYEPLAFWGDTKKMNKLLLK